MAGVAEQLGLDGLESELLLEAADRWRGWVAEDPRLMVVSELTALRPWLRTAGAGQADRVLLALAGLASPRPDEMRRKFSGTLSSRIARLSAAL